MLPDCVFNVIEIRDLALLQNYPAIAILPYRARIGERYWAGLDL